MLPQAARTDSPALFRFPAITTAYIVRHHRPFCGILAPRLRRKSRDGLRDVSIQGRALASHERNTNCCDPARKTWQYHFLIRFQSMDEMDDLFGNPDKQPQQQARTN